MDCTVGKKSISIGFGVLWGGSRTGRELVEEVIEWSDVKFCNEEAADEKWGSSQYTMGTPNWFGLRPGA